MSRTRRASRRREDMRRLSMKRVYWKRARVALRAALARLIADREALQ
jgi:hypothetical protein